MKDNSYDVSIVRCTDYQPQRVRQALLQALEPVGGLDWVRAGMTVALKANLVAAQKKETAATTHPTVLAELTRLLRERGVQVIVGDSPGGLYNEAALRRVYEATGMREVQQAGATLNDDFSEKDAVFPQAHAARSFTYTAWLEKADAIIDVCKVKSHGMMGLSVAAKNMFGVIPGTKKPEYHFRFPNMADFSNMIVDLDEYFAPVLCIADAVIGMEGNGPTQGTPRAMGALLAARSPHALDLVCAKMLGMQPAEVPTLTAAQARGLIPQDIDGLRVAGNVDAFHVEHFEKVAARSDLTFQNLAGNGALGRLFGAVARQALSSRPQVKKKLCVGCEKCRQICPAKAIEMHDRLPCIDRKRCIHCFCCQEFCPKGAMKVHRTWVARLLSR